MDDTSYQYIEDNGGGLYLFAWAEDGSIDGIGNLEYAQPGEGADVRAELDSNAYTAIRIWDGHLTNPAEVYAGFRDDATSSVVASNHGIYTERMGRAAQRYFGVTDA